MSNDFINVSTKERCSSESAYIKAIVEKKQHFLVGSNGISIKVGNIFSDAEYDVSAYACDYTVNRTSKINAAETIGQVTETAKLASSKLSIELTDQQLDNVNVVGYESVTLSGSEVLSVYAAEYLDVMDEKVNNKGFNGTYTEGFRYNDDTGRYGYAYSRKSDVTGAITLKDNAKAGYIAGYKAVIATGENWTVTEAMGETETYTGDDGDIDGNYKTTDNLNIAAVGTLTLKHMGTLGDASGYLNVSINGDDDDTRNVLVTGYVQGGTYKGVSSYVYNENTGLEKLTTSFSLGASGTLSLSNVSGAEASLRGYSTVTFNEGAEEMYIYGGTAKDGRECQTSVGYVEDSPSKITLERYAAGTADVKQGASVMILNGYDKVTVSGRAVSIDRDDILQESYRNLALDDFTNYMMNIGQAFEEDVWAYSGKIATTNTYNKDDGERTYSKTVYEAKKGSSLQINADGNVDYANGYGSVTVTGGQLTGKVSQTMLCKWTEEETYVDTYSKEGEKSSEWTSWFSAVESKADGKFTMTDGVVGEIYGYSTIKVDGVVDKKTKEVLTMARITGGIYADNYKYGYAIKTATESIDVKAAGSVTISNAYLQGNIEGIEKVTLSNVTWDSDVASSGSIYGGKRSAVLNGPKGSSDVYDVLGAVSLTSSHVGDIFGMKSITLVGSTAAGITVENSHIAARWVSESVPMENASKMSGTVILTDSSVVGAICGYSTVTVKNTAASAKVPEAGGSVLGGYQGTAGDDKVTFTNGVVQVVDLQQTSRSVVEESDVLMDFGDGKNTFTLSTGTEVEVEGDILFGASDDKLSVGQKVRFTAEDVTLGAGKNTVDIGQGADVTWGNVFLGSGDDKFTLNGGRLELDSLVFEGGKNTVDIKKGSTVILHGVAALGNHTGSTMKVAGEVFMTSQEAVESLQNMAQIKVDKTGVFTTTERVYEQLESKTISGKNIAIVGDAEEAANYQGIVTETADNTLKTARNMDDVLASGVGGWLSQDDGTGSYLTDEIDYYKLGNQQVYFSGDVVATYYDAKGKSVTDMSKAVYVSVSIQPLISGEKRTGVVTYSMQSIPRS